jgi:hypothetical protein
MAALEYGSLAVAVRMMACPLLTQRVIGMKLISAAADAILKAPEVLAYQLAGKSSLSPRRFTRWLKAERVLERLFLGEAMSAALASASHGGQRDKEKELYRVDVTAAADASDDEEGAPVLVSSLAAMVVTAPATPAPASPPPPDAAETSPVSAQLRLMPRPSHPEIIKKSSDLIQALRRSRSINIRPLIDLVCDLTKWPYLTLLPCSTIL